MAMSERLGCYLEAEVAIPAQWGRSDCVTLVAGWVATETGRNPAEGLCGYGDLKAATRLARRLGGYERAVASALDAVLFRTANPETGDVGLVRPEEGECDLLPGSKTVLAIRSGTLWVARTRRGIAGCDWPFVTAWTVT